MVSVRKQKRHRHRTYIRAWREHGGYTQERVAERLGISRENYGRIEAGKVPYNQDFLELCAEALNCTVADLLTRDPKMQSLVDELNTIMTRAHSTDQRRVLAVAKTLIDNKG